MKAPKDLYFLYQNDRIKFAKKLCYATLSDGLYARLLTLIAVRELMADERNVIVEKCIFPKSFELKFFDPIVFGSEEGQKKLKDLLNETIANIDTTSGRDWATIYVGYRYYKKQLRQTGSYTDFFTDIENLLPGCLTKLSNSDRLNERYHKYNMLLSREVKAWFMDDKKLPPQNELSLYRDDFNGDKSRFESYINIIKDFYRGLKSI